MKRSIIVLLLAFAAVACGGKDGREQSAEAIARMEQSVLLDARSIDPQKADSLVGMYKAFAQNYPQDSLSAAYLYRAADVTANRNDCLGAVGLLNELIEKFPKDIHAEQAAFLKGVIYQDVCLNKEKAAECFKQFVASYPQSPLVKDAQGMMLLNESENELDLIRKWEAEGRME